MTEHEIETLIERLKRELIPVGSIMCYASSQCPDGYLPCDGRELMQSKYPDLYKVIGKIFGGGQKTFCLPDLQGRFIRGWDEEGDTDPEREFGNFQDDAFQGHGHEIEIGGETSEAGSHYHLVNFDQETITYGRNTWNDDYKSTIHKIIGRDEYSDHKKYDFYHTTFKSSDCGGSHSHALPTLDVKGAKPSVFGSIKIDTETRPKNIALLYCIKVK